MSRQPEELVVLGRPIRVAQPTVVGVVAVALLVSVVLAPTRAQESESASPAVAEVGPSGASTSLDDGVPPKPRADEPLSPVVQAEVQRSLNELRQERLDGWAATVTWWLASVAILLTMFGVVAGFVGVFGFRRLQASEEDAKKSEENAKKSADRAEELVREIELSRDRSAELLESMTAEVAAEEPGKAQAALESVRQNRKATIVNRAIANAVALQKEGKTEKAIEQWRSIATVAELSDRDVASRAWFSVGYLLDKAEEDGIRAYSRAIDLRPAFTKAYNNRGNLRARLERDEEAMADYDAAIRVDPEYAKAYNNRGNLKSRLRRDEEAMADYDEAIRVDPENAKAYNNRGNLKSRLRRDEDAMTDYDTAIRLDPEYANAYSNRGHLKKRLGRDEEAMADYDRAIRLDPEHAPAYTSRGRLKKRLERDEEAMADYDTAIRLDPEYALAYFHRGNANVRRGRYEEAIADFDEAIRLDPSLRGAHRSRIIATRKQGLEREGDGGV